MIGELVNINMLVALPHSLKLLLNSAVPSAGSTPARVLVIMTSPPPYQGCACSHRHSQGSGKQLTGVSVVNVLI